MLLDSFTGQSKSNIKIQTPIMGLVIEGMGSNPDFSGGRISLVVKDNNNSDIQIASRTPISSILEFGVKNFGIGHYYMGSMTSMGYLPLNQLGALNMNGDNIQIFLSIEGLPNADWKFYGIEGPVSEDNFSPIIYETKAITNKIPLLTIDTFESGYSHVLFSRNNLEEVQFQSLDGQLFTYTAAELRAQSLLMTDVVGVYDGYTDHEGNYDLFPLVDIQRMRIKQSNPDSGYDFVVVKNAI